MKNQKGFSLMEVLIVSILVGVVAGISVPYYQRYSRAVKTAEAKASLGQVYLVERAFFFQWRFYTHDLLTAGIAPEGELLYNVGFKSGGTDPAKSTELSYMGPTLDTQYHDFYTLCGEQFGKSKDDTKGKIKSCAFKNKKGGFKPPKIPTKSGKEGETKKDNTVWEEGGESFFQAVAIADLKNKVPKNPSKEEEKDIWLINQYKEVKRVQNGTK